MLPGLVLRTRLQPDRLLFYSEREPLIGILPLSFCSAFKEALALLCIVSELSDQFACIRRVGLHRVVLFTLRWYHSVL